MSEAALTLFIELRPGSRIDLEAAARAALAWSRLIKSVGLRVDPFSEWVVELESSLPGSQKIRSIIRLPKTVEQKAAWIGVILTSLAFIGAQSAGWGVGQVLDYLTGQDAPAAVLELTEEERRKLAEEVVQLLREGVGRQEASEVYQALESDDDVTGAGATSNPDEPPRVVVPRDSFPRPLSDEIREEGERRTRTEEIDLLVVKPVLTDETSRKWGFESLYGKFNAVIRDTAFLSALAEGRLDVPLAQGIRLLVELEIVEQITGGVWRPVERVVRHVIRIVPPPIQVSLGLEQPKSD